MTFSFHRRDPNSSRNTVPKRTTQFRILGPPQLSIIFFSFEEHLFHESINIRGIGEKPDDVIIQSEEGEGYFVFCDSENIFFENLTLEGRRNFEGALVVNGGKCNLINVNISCDMVTRGIIVRPFAVCKGNG